MNSNSGPKTNAPLALPARVLDEDDKRVLRLERDGLRVDPPIVRFAAGRGA